jgi:hypothetical protein
MTTALIFLAEIVVHIDLVRSMRSLLHSRTQGFSMHRLF